MGIIKGDRGIDNNKLEKDEYLIDKETYFDDIGKFDKLDVIENVISGVKMSAIKASILKLKNA